MHRSVLLHEVLEYLDPKPGEFIIDGTVDGGGHAAAIIGKITPGGMFLGVDWDKSMIAKRKEERAHSKSERYVHASYAELPAILKREKLGKADGLLLDLGFSSEQLAHSGRGFSFSEVTANEPLLMTYDDSRKPVAEILREVGEEKLANIIYELGGERMSRKIAAAIKSSGKKKAIVTSGQLADIVREAVSKNYERGRIDAATRTFQALRIYANDELGNIKNVLNNLGNILNADGRVVVITFHSLEDRVVKQAFQSMAKASMITIITKKPVEPSREEIISNPRSRSAKLRAATINR